LQLPALPDEPFSVSGKVRVEPAGYGLEQVTAELGPNRLDLDGAVGPLPELVGTNLVLEISGDHLADVGRYAAAMGLGEWPALPVEAYAVSGQVLAHEAGYELRRISAVLGAARLELDGMVGPFPDLHGTDLTLDARGPDASIIGTHAGISLPAEPFVVNGGVERHVSGSRFSDLHVEIGELQGDLDGTLGEWPRFIGTELDFKAEGASLLPLAGLFEPQTLPDDAFRISGHFSGNPERFSLQGLDARLGESDLRGSFSLGLEGQPELHGEFVSQHLDLTVLGGQPASETPADALVPARTETPTGGGADAEPPVQEGREAGTEAGAAEDVGAGAEEGAQASAQAAPAIDEDAHLDEDAEQDPALARREKRRVIPGEPLDLEILRAADVDVVWKIDEVLGKALSLDDFEIGVHLRDGYLEIKPFSGSGPEGGKVQGELTLRPSGGNYRAAVRLKGEDMRLDLLSPLDDEVGAPRVDLELALDGTGGSWRELASGANGYINFVMGEGRLDSSALSFLAADVLVEILDTLNPFTRKDPFTQYECAVLLVEVNDGLAVLEPLAVRTSKMTVVGDGKIEFKTESLDFGWAAKPRKGVGLSASAITNPYIKLGGSLAEPSLDIKPIQSVTSTGAAVATAGLSILARGLWDRATAERKVCAHALKEAERRAEAREAKEIRDP
jgi:hypothetical protein